MPAEQYGFLIGCADSNMEEEFEGGQSGKRETF